VSRCQRRRAEKRLRHFERVAEFRRRRMSGGVILNSSEPHPWDPSRVNLAPCRAPTVPMPKPTPRPIAESDYYSPAAQRARMNRYYDEINGGA